MSHYVSGTKAHGSMVQILDDFRESARQPGLFGRVNGAISALDFVVRRDFFAFAIMVLCLLGLAGTAVWLVGVLAVAAVLYFAWYSRRRMRDLAAAAEKAGGDDGAR
jgi:hypothetical protein